MTNRESAIKIVKKILYLSGILADELSNSYPVKISKVCKKTEKVIETKKLYLNPCLTITMLAKEIGTNRTYLSKYMSKEKGCSFTDYINMLRAGYAKNLLFSQTKQPMADIAMMSGFGSVRALNKSFLKNFGKLPAQYRKEHLLECVRLPLQEQDKISN
ncbi:MAG: helix-turn-helix domain-containing protein [Rikenellaceae bacterium]